MAKNMQTKRIKKEKFQTEDQVDIKRFMLILIIIIVIIIGVYFFTRAFVSKDLFKSKEKTFTSGVINYNTTLIGSMFNRPEEEYFVLLCDSEASDYVYYANTLNSYIQDDKAIKIYIGDISNELNKKYIGTENNLETNDLEEFKIAESALLKIKDGKVSNVYTTKEEIGEALKEKSN